MRWNATYSLKSLHCIIVIAAILAFVMTRPFSPNITFGALSHSLMSISGDNFHCYEMEIRNSGFLPVWVAAYSPDSPACVNGSLLNPDQTEVFELTASAKNWCLIAPGRSQRLKQLYSMRPFPRIGMLVEDWRGRKVAVWNQPAIPPILVRN